MSCLSRGLVALTAFLIGIEGVKAAQRPVHHGNAVRITPRSPGATARERRVYWGAKAASARTSAARLSAELGPAWVAWDESTRMPSRLLLSGPRFPNAVNSASAAEAAARDILARTLADLSPGASVDDFILVSNESSGGLRTVGFVQTFAKTPVLGGQVSFRFRADRLVMVASDALPDIQLLTANGRVSKRRAATRAREWIVSDVTGSSFEVLSVGSPVILPLHERGKYVYREVIPVVVDVTSPRTRWSIWIDASSGEPVARRQDLLFEVGGLSYNVPVRGPLGTRVNQAARFVDVAVDGVTVVTDENGEFEFSTTAGNANNSPIGPLVALSNAAGETARLGFQVTPGSGHLWDARDDEWVDAQLTAYAHAVYVKRYVQAIAPDLTWLGGQLQITVNIDDECNAFSDGDSLNFYRSSDSCENSGRVADVVYHEFGHSVHTQSVIPGVGMFDPALSEGISDYLAATIVNDAALGRGFFFDDTPLRDNDPPDYEYRWPEDRGEVHDEGQIIAGALWDLRKLMIAKHGQLLGTQITDHIWYESTRRAVDIPSMYAEALVVDDDDGDLSNGTPNGCEIKAAYGPHGLFNAGPGSTLVTDVRRATGIEINVSAAHPMFPNCPVDMTAQVHWRLREDPDEQGSYEMSLARGVYWAVIPNPPPGSVVQYQIELQYGDSGRGMLPTNVVDPWYEVFVGDVVPLYCTSFVEGAAGWSLGPTWGTGAPSSSASSRDPGSAFADDGAELGTELSSTGLYRPNTRTEAISPVIDTSGYEVVRLQYRRWLTVEDGFYDSAQVLANGEEVWRNYASEDDIEATFHHIDDEWRFHDIDISRAASAGQVQLSFVLDSDQGVEFGGWNIDELCVVAIAEAPSCGNGAIETGEECDDGNTLSGDGCSEGCVVEASGDPANTGLGETDESGDPWDGAQQTSDGLGLDDDALIDRGCACTVELRREGPRLPLGLVGMGLLLRRRRRRRGEIPRA